jgi:hypothetical protein
MGDGVARHARSRALGLKRWLPAAAALEFWVERLCRGDLKVGAAAQTTAAPIVAASLLLTISMRHTDPPRRGRSLLPRPPEN